MAELRIPDQSLDALEVLLALPDGALAELLDALRRVRLSLNADAVVAAVSPAVKSVESKQLGDAVQAILSMNATRAHSEAPAAEFVEDLLKGLQGSGRETFKFSAEKRKATRDRFLRILNIDEVSTAAKAMHLQQDHERLFSSARILTDARPVYGSDPSEKPVAILVGHTLKLSYYRDAQLKDFYVFLDGADLVELGEVVERAKKKARSLKDVFATTTVRLIES